MAKDPAVSSIEVNCRADTSRPEFGDSSPGDHDMDQVEAVSRKLSGDADPTKGWLGPYLVVMLTFKPCDSYDYEVTDCDDEVGHGLSFKNEEEIRTELFGDTGYADMINEASWGQYKLRSSDVHFIRIDTGNIDPIHHTLSELVKLVTAKQHYKHTVKWQDWRTGERHRWCSWWWCPWWWVPKRPYTRTLIFQPDQPECLQSPNAKKCGVASAGILGSQVTWYGDNPTFSRYRGSGQQDWQVIAHELGHNDGLMQ